jgi:glycosyltransferase involved in cell wall biosynthesis
MPGSQGTDRSIARTREWEPMPSPAVNRAGGWSALCVAPLPEAPLVSVLMANYNYSGYIGQAIESVLGQTYQNFEIVVCDDGSTDDSREVIQKYADRDPRVRLVCKENGGQASAFNAAFGKSRGEVVCLLDSDDLFETDKLRQVVDVFRADSTCGLVSHAIEMIDEQGKHLRTLTFSREGNIGLECHATLYSANLLPACSGLCFRREVLNEIFPIPEVFRIHGDSAISAPAVHLTAVRTLPVVLSQWRIHGTNNGGCGSLLPVLTVEWLEDQLSWHERAMKYVKEFVEKRGGSSWDILAFRPILEYRIALAILKGQRREAMKAAGDLVYAYKHSRAGYGWSRMAFWWATAALPNGMGSAALQSAFQGLKWLRLQKDRNRRRSV